MKPLGYGSLTSSFSSFAGFCSFGIVPPSFSPYMGGFWDIASCSPHVLHSILIVIKPWNNLLPPDVSPIFNHFYLAQPILRKYVTIATCTVFNRYQQAIFLGVLATLDLVSSCFLLSSSFALAPFKPKLFLNICSGS